MSGDEDREGVVSELDTLRARREHEKRWALYAQVDVPGGVTVRGKSATLLSVLGNEARVQFAGEHVKLRTKEKHPPFVSRMVAYGDLEVAV